MEKKRTATEHTRSRKHEGEEDDRGEAECPAKVEGATDLAKELLCRFQSAECLTRSQALAFIGVLSLGPVLLFALAALGFVIHDTAQVAKFVHDLVGQLLPGRQASEAANNLIAQTRVLESAESLMQGKWWAVAIGVVSLLWAAINLFVGASDPMNASWNVKETRGCVKLARGRIRRFRGSGPLIPTVAYTVVPTQPGRSHSCSRNRVTAARHVVDRCTRVAVGNPGGCRHVYSYLSLPAERSVTWKAALFGGAVAGVLWELFKKGFAVYLTHFGDYNKLYGALGGAVLLVTWIWYSCVLLLVGAILCKMYHEHAEEGGVVRTVTEQPRPSLMLNCKRFSQPVERDT